MAFKGCSEDNFVRQEEVQPADVKQRVFTGFLQSKVVECMVNAWRSDNQVETVVYNGLQHAFATACRRRSRSSV